VKDVSSFQTVGDDVDDNINVEAFLDDEDLYSEGLLDTDGNDDDVSFDYERDEDDIRTEREDRLYVDDSGRRVKVETCVLVGVEELAAMRKDRRYQHRQLLADSSSSGNVKNDLDVYFSMEESMTEMRDLIKTSGLELVGEVTQRLNEVNPKTYIGTGKLR